MKEFNLVIVFIEGLFSFFSPCILPVLPIYLSILSNSSIAKLESGETKFTNSALFKNTLGFVLGISATFFLLGSSINVLSTFFSAYKEVITLVGGIIIIFMGLFYVDFIQVKWMNREKRFHMQVSEMKGITSFILGFTFSFGWTPCIGPMLASVLIMSSTATSRLMATWLIAIYTLGFIIPFIVLALFYDKLFKQLEQIKKHMGLIKKLGGIILIIAGVLMAFSGLRDINRSKIIDNPPSQQEEIVNNEENTEEVKVKAIDFTLYDQYGNKHQLSEYEGKTVFLNFWATWCTYCIKEMPYIEELYKEYGENKEDVVILGVAAPNLGREVSEERITQFLADAGHTFPVVYDNDGSTLYQYGINSFPNTFIIDKEGYIQLYAPGAMDKETMREIIEKAR
ncbi:cytochrome C biogenesis protein CcsB [Sporanaerobium hydrogeniformans]|uniref:Cytochrome C biogenesis protein CcsB n=1 Tax=Sporanaerobium hydrogeniformans TaxID=3072179 RepID=A0AC61DAH9_9FIRM|nr:cytochrome c biogenesis protein/redoxin [Sporanaerobium hydrogeniformans]PHV69681.1 cytochrome C biogenesis protein CcsB [Sporanaerobium hydrogeniformans]